MKAKTKLQLLREQLQLTQQQLGELVDVPQSSISLSEKDKRQLSINSIKKIITIMQKKHNIPLIADDFINNIYIDQEFLKRCRFSNLV